MSESPITPVSRLKNKTTEIELPYRTLSPEDIISNIFVYRHSVLIPQYLAVLPLKWGR